MAGDASIMRIVTNVVALASFLSGLRFFGLTVACSYLGYAWPTHHRLLANRFVWARIESPVLRLLPGVLTLARFCALLRSVAAPLRVRERSSAIRSRPQR